MQFCAYTGLAALYLSCMMCLSLVNVLSSPKPKLIMNKPYYGYAFIMGLVAFIEGLLFAYFTYELWSEQIDSIENNQSYIDDLKN